MFQPLPSLMLPSAQSTSGGGNYTILLADGTYELTTPLYISVNQVMLRSNSGNRNSVLLTGQGMDGSITHIFQVMGSDITIADLSIGEVSNHAYSGPWRKRG